MLTKVPTNELQGIDGHDLLIGLRRLNPRQRAVLAKDLVTGEKQLSRFTRRQASKICNVCLPLLDEAMNGKKKLEPRHCVAWWQQASFSDRVDFVRACGVAEVWDAISTAVA
jgi:hypothetical protein